MWQQKPPHYEKVIYTHDTHIQAEVYREDFESERGDREKAVAQKEQYRSEMLSLQKQIQQAKDVLVQND